MKKVWIFIISTFLITWTIWGLLSNLSNVTAQLVITGTMFIPGIMAVLTKFVFKKKEDIKLNIKPNIKGNVKYYLAAWFLPAIITLVGCIIYFIIFNNFDINVPYYRAALQPAIEMGQISERDVMSILIAEIISALTIAPFINMFFAFGEELGWRGLLFPALCEKYSTKKSIVISGLIWGLWHAPIIIIGHNYGTNYWGYPIMGIVAMSVFCVFFGSFLSYITLKTQSVWPASIAHGAINAIAGVGIYFVADISKINFILGPTVAGLIGGIGCIILGIICWEKCR